MTATRLLLWSALGLVILLVLVILFFGIQTGTSSG